MKFYRDASLLKEEIKKSGFKRVVFTNGVFDIIHPGHIELLKFAAAQGDCLVLGINSDESTRRLKGETRPVFNLEDRAEVLEAVQYISYIVPFGEDTPLELIKELLPIHVLVKGGDYKPEEVVGRSEVKSCGGELKLFSFKEGYSTTNIVDKVQK